MGPFNPDARLKAILEKAAVAVTHAQQVAPAKHSPRHF